MVLPLLLSVLHSLPPTSARRCVTPSTWPATCSRPGGGGPPPRPNSTTVGDATDRLRAGRSVEALLGGGFSRRSPAPARCDRRRRRESMRLIAEIIESRWPGSPSSNSKRIFETRSEPVCDVELRMLTWPSDRARATSESRRGRSRAFTSMAATNIPECSVSHSTSITRSSCPVESDTALAQSARCTDTPRPRVTNPSSSSPGTGVQHFDRRTMTSSSPSTWTPTVWRSREARRGWRAVVGSCSSTSGSPPRSWRTTRRGHGLRRHVALRRRRRGGRRGRRS